MEVVYFIISENSRRNRFNHKRYILDEYYMYHSSKLKLLVAFITRLEFLLLGEKVRMRGFHIKSPHLNPLPEGEGTLNLIIIYSFQLK